MGTIEKNNNYINIFKVNNFEVHQKNLINLIHQIPETSLKTEKSKISHTDWHIPATMKREYLEYFIKYIYEGYAKNLCDVFDAEKVEPNNFWFQKYNQGDSHCLHRHGNVHFTNVFYLKIPEKYLNTKIYNLDKEIISIDIKEGDILTFPAFLKHESVENKNEDYKMIISFNVDIV